MSRELEELHRCAVPVPLFRVDLAPIPGTAGIDLSTSLTVQHVHTTDIGRCSGVRRDAAILA
jgi:hypothetical protein